MLYFYPKPPTRNAAPQSLASTFIIFHHVGKRLEYAHLWNLSWIVYRTYTFSQIRELILKFLRQGQ